MLVSKRLGQDMTFRGRAVVPLLHEPHLHSILYSVDLLESIIAAKKLLTEHCIIVNGLLTLLIVGVRGSGAVPKTARNSAETKQTAHIATESTEEISREHRGTVTLTWQHRRSQGDLHPQGGEKNFFQA